MGVVVGALLALGATAGATEVPDDAGPAGVEHAVAAPHTVEVGVAASTFAHRLQPMHAGLRLSIPFADRNWLEVSASHAPRWPDFGPVGGTNHTTPATWSDRNFQQTLRWVRTHATVEYGSTLLRGQISVADEAIVDLDVAAMAGAAIADVGELHGVWETPSVDRGLDRVALGPTASLAVRLGLSARILLRADVGGMLLVLPKPHFDPQEPPPEGTRATVWPSVGIGAASRLGRLDRD